MIWTDDFLAKLPPAPPRAVRIALLLALIGGAGISLFELLGGRL
ncbi:MAG TPA: hypothetical protein VHC90_09715 [Bryobacteraceae bacterium]|nr:hypothetical protein [Bryobacteraceae bacterium]